MDDNALLRRTLTPILESAGYTTVCADSGDDAVKAAQNQQIDLVLLDLLMPGMSGPDTFEKLRTIKPGIKVIVMTGYFLPNMEDTCRKLGAVGCLHKPFDPDDLRAKVAAALGN